MKYIRVGQMSEKLGIGKSTVWLWVKDKKLPSPIKLSPRVTVWIEDEIDQWMMLNKCQGALSSDEVEKKS